MSKVLITRSKLDDLAVAVSAKSGATLPLTIAQMQTAVEGIQPGGTLVTKSITQNGTYDAEDDNADGYSSVTVNVSSGGSTYSLTNIVPTQTVATTTSNLYGYVGLIPSYTAYVQSGEWYLVTYDSTEYVCTGYYGANSEIMAGDYQLLTTDVPWVETPFLVEHNLTNGYFFLGSRVSGNHTLKVDKINFLDDGVTLINKTITANGTYNASSDSADGFETVTVNVPSSAPNLQTKTNISPTTSSQTITADSGYDGLSSVQINAMPSGSVTAPSSISGTSATVSTGTNTLTLTKSVSVTPNVTTAGYISSGTAGNASVSLTASVTTQAAQTIYPSSSDQSIASGRYLTGAQTIKAVTTSNLTAANIKKGVTVTVGDSADADRILSVTGTYEGGGGSTKNIQAYIGRASRTANSYGATDATLTVAKTGTYTVSWTAWRSSSSGTMGTNLHRNSTSGTNQQTWTNTYGQQIQLTNQSYTAGDVLTLYATSGSNSRTINVANLIIEEE